MQTSNIFTILPLQLEHEFKKNIEGSKAVSVESNILTTFFLNIFPDLTPQGSFIIMPKVFCHSRNGNFVRVKIANIP